MTSGPVKKHNIGFCSVDDHAAELCFGVRALGSITCAVVPLQEWAVLPLLTAEEFSFGDSHM